jgi:hypothetical protein
MKRFTNKGAAERHNDRSVRHPRRFGDNPYFNVDQIVRKRWFRYRGFDGFRWHYQDGRDSFWVILQGISNGLWKYRVEGTRRRREVQVTGPLQSDPQLAIITGMVWVERCLVRPPKPPIIGPAPVIHLSEYKASKA